MNHDSTRTSRTDNSIMGSQYQKSHVTDMSIPDVSILQLAQSSSSNGVRVTIDGS